MRIVCRVVVHDSNAARRANARRADVIAGRACDSGTDPSGCASPWTVTAYVPSSARIVVFRPAGSEKTWSGATEPIARPAGLSPSHHGAGFARTARVRHAGLCAHERSAVRGRAPGEADGDHRPFGGQHA